MNNTIAVPDQSQNHPLQDTLGVTHGQTPSPSSPTKVLAQQAFQNRPEPAQAISTNVQVVYDTFEQNLWAWVLGGKDSNDRANRQNAAVRIQSAYDLKLNELYFYISNLSDLPNVFDSLTSLQSLNLRNNKFLTFPSALFQLKFLNTLTLSDNSITELPKEIGNLISLKKLDVDGNRLTKLPEEIGNLTKLKTLMLFGNQLVEFPMVILKLTALTKLNFDNNQLNIVPDNIGVLTALKDLSFKENRLSSIPVTIGNFRKLKTLDLSGNNIQHLPASMGFLTKLEQLRVHENKALSELPISLGQIPTLSLITIYETQISESIRDGIQRLCKETNNEFGNPENLLSLRLKAWESSAQSERNLSDTITGLSSSQKKILNKWLERLEMTLEFSKTQGSLAKIVCDILTTVFQNPSFFEFFFVQANQNNECCEDRAAMALNELYTSWKIHTLQENASIEKKFKILNGVAKTLTLRRLLEKKIDAHEKKNNGRKELENVEIFLYYESSLRGTLGLETAIMSMTYGEIGKRDWINATELPDEVDKYLFDSLYSIPAFQELLLEDAEIKMKFDALLDENHKKLEGLGPRPIGDQFAEDILVYDVKMGEIMEELNTKKMEIAQKWYENATLGKKRSVTATSSQSPKRFCNKPE